MALFQAQPEGLGTFPRLTALSVAYLAQPNRAPSALLAEKRSPAVIKMKRQQTLEKIKVTPKVISSERRRAQRIVNDQSHSHVLLRLHVGDDGQETVHAADVSISGIGLKAYSSIRIGTPVQLEFNAGDCDITRYGKITWCSKESDQSESQEGRSFRLGVSFEANDAEADTLFYLAIKQRIVRPD